MRKVLQLKQADLFLTLMFGFFSYEYTATFAFVQNIQLDILSGKWLLGNIFMSSLTSILGFAAGGICKATVRRFFAGKNKYGNFSDGVEAGGFREKTLLGVIAVIYCAAVAGMLLNIGSGLFVAVSNLAVFCVGLYGGIVYEHLAVMLYETDCMGKVMGIGYCGAVLLQMALHHEINRPEFRAALLMAGFLAVCFLLFANGTKTAYKQEDSTETFNMTDRDTAGCKSVGSDKDEKIDNNVSGRTLFRLILITILFTFFFTSYNEKLLRMLAASVLTGFDIYGWPRIFVGISAVCVGISGDFKKRKYVPFVSLCMVVPALITTLLPMDGQTYYLNMSIFYASLGAEISYLHLMFWDIAARTQTPGLWACMGRIVSGAAELVFAGVLVPAMPDLAVVGTELVLIVLTVGMMAFNGDLDIAAIKEIPDQTIPVKETEFRTMEEYQEFYELTNKETEVLQRLITTEDNLQEIADEMAITRRVLQKHITSLYGKTGTKTRIGLLQHYTLFLTKGAEGTNRQQKDNQST